MRAWTWQIVAAVVSVLMVLAVATVAPAASASAVEGIDAGWGASALTDGKTIDGRFEVLWPGGLITTGPVVSWNKAQPDHLWGGGLFGQLAVTPNGSLPLANLFPWLGSWLGLPETVPVRIELGTQVEMVNVAHDPGATAAQYVQIGLGPVLLEPYVQQVEGGSLEDLAKSGVGIKIGVRPIRF